MEVELKLLLDPRHAARLREHPLLARQPSEAPVLLAMHDIYVDTPDLQLCRHQAGLRVRQVDAAWVQTLKAGGSVRGGLHSRHEWESEVDGPQVRLDALDAQIKGKQPVRALLRRKAIRGNLQTVFSTRIERLVWQLATPQGDLVECVLDQGLIESGENSVPVSEVELELKAGRPAALFDIALALLREVPLWIGQASKAERGYRLAAGLPVNAVKARPLHLGGKLSVQRGFQAIAANCLEQISANQDGVAGSEDVESLHQMRVGLRRLRSAFSLFKPLLALPEDLQADLDWLAGTLGAARDWDVLVNDTLAPCQGDVDASMLAPLIEAARGQARAAHAQAAEALADVRYTRLLLQLQRWLLTCGWREGATPRQRRALEQPLPRFARQALRQRQRRLRKRGKLLLTGTPEQRHAIRIAAKKARYAAEFFASLFSDGKVRAYVKPLSGLQDVLGGLNDLQVADGLLRQLADRQAALQEPASFVRGYLAARAQERLGDAQGMRRAWRRFRAARLPG
ncbi:CYTH and CHAD domain-containing protein [Janthinobacterium psychrotolerans]|uniref:Inorganic triphosphatase YgiF n=1 Tax=Janthinobacterium psychrotolerans TaxID=1747903 RepID=A0A1A7C395_9BURK|nr:CYTH and CHAD domain-containing protein [Janthinobacterium psychrotolerans]OBV39195.1 Inorganic triphosphatase YgiF [Janthinobacterium psychrotolerans]